MQAGESLHAGLLARQCLPNMLAGWLGGTGTGSRQIAALQRRLFNPELLLMKLAR